ncbi:hypothetical protein R6Q57_007292 [Mikania cordata]
MISRDTRFFEENFPFRNDKVIYEEVDAFDPLKTLAYDGSEEPRNTTVNNPVVDESIENEGPTNNEEPNLPNTETIPQDITAINGMGQTSYFEEIGQLPLEEVTENNEASHKLLSPL